MPSPDTPRAPRFLSPTWVRVLGLVLLALALSVYTYWPSIAQYPASPNGDGQQTQRLLESAKVSLSRYHELPLWDPFECAGRPLWDEPESIAAAPLLFRMLPLTATASIIIWNILHQAAAFVCMWLLCRHELRLSRGATLVASTVFAFTLAHTGQYAGGHAALVGFVFAPLVVLLWRRAETDLRFAVGLGVVFAWIFWEGGGYPSAHLGLILVIESLFRVTLSNLRKMSAGVALALGTFAVLGAGRLLPVIDQLMHHARSLPVEGDVIVPRTFLEMFFSRSHAIITSGQQYLWPEYGAYVGVFIGALACAGMVVCLGGEAWFLALGMAVLLLMVGHYSRWAPWHILKLHVFPWSSMRVPSRFRLVYVMFIGGWVGMAIDTVPAWAARRLGRRIGAALGTALLGLGLIGAGDALSVAAAKVAWVYTSQPAKEVMASPRLFVGGELGGILDQPRQNQARKECWEEWDFTRGAPVWEGDVAQARSEDPNVTVGDVTRTQNTFTIDVTAAAPGVVLVNTPYDRGWRSDVGKVREADKLLVVDVPAGRTTVHLAYRPHGLDAGLALSGFGLVATIAFFFEDRRKRRAREARPGPGAPAG